MLCTPVKRFTNYYLPKHAKMGRMDVGKMRYLQMEHFRVLIAVEMGMKNHEIVPLPLISIIAGIHRGMVARTLSDLCKYQLVAYERGKKFDGYRLTVLGYDYLALRALCTRDVVGSVGNKIGVGKESDVYVGGDPDLNDLCLKFHRLGRTSFRKIKEKRDYHKSRHSASWLYLSRLAATKEYAFLKALYDKGFPVPRPVDACRHLVVMGLIEGKTLCHIDSVSDPGALYDRLMSLIVKMARYGLIHGDFNEFNLMLTDDEKVIMIDFPQMVSTDHENADYYFNRDVECVRTFFKRKFDYDSDDFPQLSDVERKYSLDVELEASGFTKQMAVDLNKAYDEGDFRVHCEADQKGERSSDDEDEDEEEEEGDNENDDDDSEDDSETETMKEEPSDVDQLEVEEEQREAKVKAKELKTSTRFSEWLDTATAQMGDVQLGGEGDGDGQSLRLQEHPRDVEREEELRRDREQYIRQREEADKADAVGAAEGEGVPESAEDLELEERIRRLQKKKATAGTRSVVSTGSTIPPEEIKKRVALESMRNKQRTKLKVKGKQNAVRRGRKDNNVTIKEYDGWM